MRRPRPRRPVRDDRPEGPPRASAAPDRFARSYGRREPEPPVRPAQSHGTRCRRRQIGLYYVRAGRPRSVAPLRRCSSAGSSTLISRPPGAQQLQDRSKPGAYQDPVRRRSPVRALSTNGNTVRSGRGPPGSHRRTDLASCRPTRAAAPHLMRTATHDPLLPTPVDPGTQILRTAGDKTRTARHHLPLPGHVKTPREPASKPPRPGVRPSRGEPAASAPPFLRPRSPANPQPAMGIGVPLRDIPPRRARSWKVTQAPPATVSGARSTVPASVVSQLTRATLPPPTGRCEIVCPLFCLPRSTATSDPDGCPQGPNRPQGWARRRGPPRITRRPRPVRRGGPAL